MYQLKKYSDIATYEMESERVSKKCVLLIKKHRIASKKDIYKEKNIGIELESRDTIMRNSESKDIYTYIHEDKWYNDRMLRGEVDIGEYIEKIS